MHLVWQVRIFFFLFPPIKKLYPPVCSSMPGRGIAKRARVELKGRVIFLYLRGTYSYKNGARPPSCAAPRHQTIYTTHVSKTPANPCFLDLHGWLSLNHFKPLKIQIKKIHLITFRWLWWACIRNSSSVSCGSIICSVLQLSCLCSSHCMSCVQERFWASWNWISNHHRRLRRIDR